MRYILIIIVALILVCNLFGCSSNTPYVPRQSFVKVNAELRSEKCDSDELCMHQYMVSAASGSIIANKRKSYILTAGHVCNKDAYKAEIGVDHIKVRYRVTDAHGITHKAKLFKLDKENDLCLLILNQRLNLPAIKIRFHGPIYGEKVYNLASPTGFSGKNYVPILEGYYSGFTAFRMIFTIPAIGGSSGSPVFDKNGNLVGMIIAVHTRFPMISFSPHFHAIEEIISSIKN